MQNKLFIYLILFLLNITIYSCNNNQIKEYYYNGNIKSISSKDKKGKLYGRYKYFYYTGVLKLSQEFENGLANGECIHYFENGKPAIILKYHNDTIVGKTTFFYESGNLEKVFYHLENGIQYGNYYEYYDSNKPLKDKIVQKYSLVGDDMESFNIEFDSIGNVIKVDSNFLII